MEGDDFSISSSSLLSECISSKIQKAGYDWQVSPTRNCPNNKVLTTMKDLCGEFEKRYEKEFSEQCLSCCEVELTREGYTTVLEQLIEGGLNWGRVVALFAFAGAMSVHCMKNGQRERVDWIKDWSYHFINSKVENWINENNGWKGLVDFYKNGTQKADDKPKEENGGWGSLLMRGAYNAVKLGVTIMNKAYEHGDQTK